MLEFEIKNQTIKRTDRFNPATDSVDYLTAKFNFLTTDWDGYSKTAIFKAGTKSYSVVINKDNECKVPAEVLVASDKSRSQLVGNNKIFVSVFGLKGTSRIPTNEIRIDLNTSGYVEGETPAEVTPDAYAQYVEQVRQLVDEVNTPDQEYNPESEAGQSGKAVAQGIEQHNADTEAHADIRTELTERANALKGNSSGEIVRVDNVSPVEHKASVKVRGKNLLPFSAETSNTNGTNYVIGEDGSVTLDVKPSTGFCLTIGKWENPVILKGTYTMSIGATLPNGSYFFVKDTNNNRHHLMTYYTDGATEKTFVLDGTYTEYGMWVSVDGTYNNHKFYPMLEAGDTATEYEPYIDPSSVTVTRCGKNLIPYPFYNATKSENGITFTDNQDGTITVNGTAKDNAFFHFLINENIKVKGTYILSGLTGGSGSTYYIQPFISGNAVSGLTNKLKEYEWDGELEKITMVVTSGTTLSNLVVKLQLEAGDKATDFEAYNPETYTPDTNGSCEITSLAPTMTLLTDTAGVTIDLEYNKDINAENEAVRADITELDRITGEHTNLIGDFETALDELHAYAQSLVGGGA